MISESENELELGEVKRQQRASISVSPGLELFICFVSFFLKYIYTPSFPLFLMV